MAPVSSNSSIKTLEPTANKPLNSYKDFAQVFNVKGMQQKSRKHKFASEN